MYLKSGQKEFGYLRHLMLIYDSFKEEEYLPYVAAVDEKGNPKEWLFDSFLFYTNAPSGNSLGSDVNLGTTMSGEGNFYPIPCPNPGNKKDWEDGIEVIISRAKAVSSCIEKTAKILGEPEHKRNIVAIMPYPGILQSLFGTIDGKRLNFSVLGQNLMNATEDRYAACKWFADSFVKRWNEENISNLNFLGFYWPFESVYRGWEVDDHWVLKELHKYINNMGYKFFWIPFYASYNLHLLDDYQNYYFDAAFMQPNYMFYKNIKGVKEGAEAAKKRNAGFEMEYYLNLGEPVTVGSERKQRFRGYLNGGVEYGYMHGACAWYFGGKMSDMLKIPGELEIYKDIIDFVKERYQIR